MELKDAHVDVAISKAWAAFMSLKHVLVCKRSALKKRAQVLNSKVSSIVLWSAYAWRPSKKAIERINSMQASMLAAMIACPREPNDTWQEVAQSVGTHENRMASAT